MSKKLFFLFFLFAMTINTFAQEENKTISGMVTDEEGNPVIGADVYVDGTSSGTLTDDNGNFELEISNDATITVSIDGYETQELPTEGLENFTIQLVKNSDDFPIEDEQQSLQEVVVIGYGTAKKSDLTGSVGVIDSKKLTERNMTNPLEAIQGNVAGVQISTATGRIGDGFNIVIRGKNSMNSDSQPLFVVDGVPTNDIDFLNPQDIDRIDILKDASSTAIYGSRGSNGVVIVTTKNGANAKGRFTISYDTYYGVKNPARLPKMMSGQKWWTFHKSAYLPTAPVDASTGAVSEATLLNAVLGTTNSELWRRVNANETFDWYDAVLRAGTQQNNYINISGRADNGMGYNLGIGVQSEKGNLQNESLDKYTINLGVDHKINEKFSTGANITFSLTEQQDGSEYAMQEAFRMSPFYTPYALDGTTLFPLPGKLTDADGNFIINKTSTYNPLLEIQNSSDETRRWNGVGSFYFQYQPIKWISFKTAFSTTYDSNRRGRAWGALTSIGANNNNLPSSAVTNSEMFSYTWDNQVNLNFDINDIHSFNILGLQSIYSNRFEEFAQSSRNIPFETGFYNTGSGDQSTFNIGSNYIKQTLASYALRMNYSLLNKYLLTFSIRWDGASLMSKGNQWDYFPSGAFAWKISEEEFLKESSVVSDLKFRASFGYTGNNIIQAYSSKNLLNEQTYYDYNGTTANGWVPGMLANPNLSWEKTREFNLGLDFGLLKNRITGTVDVYDKRSKDLLMKQVLPYETGWDYTNGNVGSVSNRGIEASLTTKIINSSKVKWETTFTFSKNVNKIKSLYGRTDADDIGNNLFIGESIDSYYNYVFDGIWQPGQEAEAASYNQSVGQARVKDINGDGQITPEGDRVILGSSNPDWSGAVFSSLKVGQFDFSFSIITNQGVLAYSPFHENFTNTNDKGRQKLDINWFIPENSAGLPTQLSNQYPQAANEGTYWRDSKVGYYRDASFVKVKNIALGYTFDKDTLNRWGIFNSLRIYVNVLNPFVFTDYDGYDPEWATASLGIGRVSSVTYQMGLSVKF